MLACCLVSSCGEVENIPAVAPPPDTSIVVGRSGEKLPLEPAKVELTGKLVTRAYFGSPNFGEDPKSDGKDKYPVLELSSPVSVGNSPGETLDGISEMQLVLTLPHKDLIGKKVIVTGGLFRAESGFHHTDVLMTVGSIRAGEK